MNQTVILEFWSSFYIKHGSICGQILDAGLRMLDRKYNLKTRFFIQNPASRIQHRYA
jgi:hypothetical protein